MLEYAQKKGIFMIKLNDVIDALEFVNMGIETYAYYNPKDNKIFYMDLSFIDSLIDTVKITEDEYNLLLERYPKKLVHDKIKALDRYKDIDSKYNRHIKALDDWCERDKDKEEYKEKPKRRPKKDIYAFLKD